MNKFLILACLLVSSAIAGMFVLNERAHGVSQDKWDCSYSRDTLFVSGAPVTTRVCTVWGVFTVADQTIRNDEANYVGRCNDAILYLNRVEDFPKSCEWVERAPNVFAQQNQLMGALYYKDRLAAADVQRNLGSISCTAPTDDGRWAVYLCE